MKRQTFLQAISGTAVLLIASVAGLGKTISNYRTKTGFKVDTGKDRFQKPIALMEGDVFCTKISSRDTNGDMYVYESTRSKEGGPNYHYHFSQDEWWYVFQGEFLIKIGDVTYNAKAGDSVFGPRMVPHSFAKVGPGEARLLQIFQPAGLMEQYFRKISDGIVRNLNPEQQDKLREAHGIKRVGPPLTNTKKL